MSFHLGRSARARGIAEARQLQIAELRKHNPVAREVETPNQPGSIAFEIGLQLQDGSIILMRIALGKDFPHTPPVVQLLSRCSHPWLSSDGYYRVVGHNGLNSWTAQSNLGRVVHEIVAEFCAHPPVRPGPAASPPAGGGSTGGPATAGAGAQGANPPPYSSYSSYGHKASTDPAASSTGSARTEPSVASKSDPAPARSWNMPVVGSSFGEVKSLSAEELTSYLDDDSGFSEFLDTVAGYKKLTKYRDDVRARNAELARENLSHEEELTALQSEISSLRNVLKQKKKGYDELVSRQQVILERSSPAQLLAVLQAKNADLDAESEELADEFVRDDYDDGLKQFRKEYMKLRTLFHKRSAIAQRYRAQQGF